MSMGVGTAFSILLRYLGIDFHVAATLVFRGWGVLAGGVMLLLIPIGFDGKEQGYYYAFASLLALQVFFELGLNQVIVQLVGHEAAHVDFSDHAQVGGELRCIDRLSSLVHLVQRCYLVASLLFAISVGLFGAYFFWKQDQLPIEKWLLPWSLLTAASAFNLYFSPFLAILEGCGNFGEVSRLRFKQSFFGYIATWISIISGLGLTSIVFVPFVAAVFTAVFISRSNNPLKALRVRKNATGERISWKREIFPFQWKIGLSWISGYFIFQLFVPLVFKYQGAVEAGQLGIGLAIVNSLTAISLTWMTVKVPVLAAHISRNEKKQLRALFVSSFLRTLGVCVFLALISVFALWAFRVNGSNMAQRFPDVWVYGLLAAAMVVNVTITSMALFIRAHKVEPLLVQSLVVAIFAFGLFFALSQKSTAAMLMGYLGLIVFVSLPWVYYIFLRYFRFQPRKSV